MPFYAESFQVKRQWPLRADDKRVSLLGSRTVRVFRGSMTVEAALALPLYIFFLCNVLFLMEAVRMESSLDAALHETGMQICEYAGLARETEQLVADGMGGRSNEETKEDPAEERTADGLLVSTVLAEGYTQSKVLQYLGGVEAVNRSCIAGGAAGLSFLRSSILNGDDYIDLWVDYQIRPFIPLLGPAVYSLQNRFYAHAFTGYDAAHGNEDENSLTEEMVYVTPNGRVYHRSRECTYLKPSIRAVQAKDLDSLRNSSGGRYHACEICHPAKGGIVLITDDGDRYHVNRRGQSICSGIKRTVMEVPLSSVSDRLPGCSKCGGSS